LAPQTKASIGESLSALFGVAAAARLEVALAAPGAVLATDADGTLWSDDIGEGFLQRLVADSMLVSPEARGDVWAEYERRVHADRAAGFAWAVQVMAGLSEAEVVRRAEAFAREFVPAHEYREMTALVRRATELGATPWIVSASNQWIVAAAAPLVGVESAHALGIRVEVRDGLLTRDLVRPLTYGAGKVARVDADIGVRPAVAAGDSPGDRELLDAAVAERVLVLKPAGATDPALLAHARAGGWIVVDFAPARRS
jgi:phosphoserine phosphatase